MNQESNTQTNFRIHLPLLLMLFCVSVAIYWPTLGADFTNWDDQYLIVRNLAIRSLSLASVWTASSQFFLNHYHPLVILSFAIDYAMDGLNPFVFHLTNILINALNCCLTYVIAFRLSQNKVVALIAASLFAVHPTHVEAVAWVSARKDLLCTLFFFSAMVWHLRSREHSVSSSFITGLLFLLALLSKATAVTLPIVLIGLDYWCEGTLRRPRLLEKLPLFLIAGIFSLVAVKAQYSTGDVWSGFILTVVQHFFLPFYNILFYISKFVAPVGLSPFYPYPGLIGEGFSAMLWIAPLLIGTVGAYVYAHARTNRLFAYSVGFFVVALLPTLQILPVGRAVAADRFLYLPSLGLCIATAVAFNAFCLTIPRRALRVVNAVAGILLVSLGFLTVQQTAVWQNSFSLWTEVIRHYPRLAEAHSKLGVASIDAEDFVSARDEFSRAIALNSHSPEFYFNRALANHSLRSIDSSLADIDSAIAHSYLEGTLFQLRGQILFEKRNYRGAIAEFDRALQLEPYLIESHVNRGFAYLNLGLPDSAKTDVQWGISKGFRFDESILQQVGIALPRH